LAILKFIEPIYSTYAFNHDIIDTNQPKDIYAAFKDLSEKKSQKWKCRCLVLKYSRSL